MPESGLPEAFRDLEPWLGWCLATETERSDKRQASSQDELQAFYDALLARMDAVFAYLGQFPPDELPAEAQRLFLLALSLAEVAPAIEQFGQPQVVDGYDIGRVTPARRGIS
ncbi:MAG: hypothetical protein J4F42_12780 [Desulfurellaceae bacterium]|nr:hypothetical protein [Desulfurellaceae bacterium]